MNLNDLKNMRACWPPETAKIVGRKDYGSDHPVSSFRQSVKDAVKKQWKDEDNRIEALAIAGVCVIISLCLWTLLHVMPGAIDGLMAHQQEVVEESRK